MENQSCKIIRCARCGKVIENGKLKIATGDKKEYHFECYVEDALGD